MQRVLVADDDSKALALMAEVLEDAGYSVVRAANGRDAIDSLKHAPVELVVTDLHMPLVTGMEVLEYVRLSDSSTPVIIVTADGEAHAKEQASVLGAADYLIKPIDVDDMLERIKQLLAAS